MVREQAVSAAEHEQIVRKLAYYLKRRFYRDLRADTQGFRSPRPVRDDSDIRRPDVSMVARGNQEHLFEVETTDSIRDPHTASEWPVFASYAERTGARFWLVVPRGSAREAEERLRELDLSATVWEM